MIFNSNRLKSFIDKGQEFYNLGRDIFREGYRVYQERTGKAEMSGAEERPREPLRENLAKNFSVNENLADAELARQTSLKSHMNRDIGFGEKWNSNQQQRNYDNHQGN